MGGPALLTDQSDDLALNLRHDGAYRDRSVTKNVGIDASSMGKVIHDSRAREFLQVSARFAEFDAKALDFSDPKSPSDEIIKSYSRNGELTASGSLVEADVGHDLLFDERQRVTRGGALGVKMPVADETLASDGLN